MIYQIKAKGLTLTAKTKSTRPSVICDGGRLGTLYEVDGYENFIFEPDDYKGVYIIDYPEETLAQDSEIDVDSFEEAIEALKKAECERNDRVKSTYQFLSKRDNKTNENDPNGWGSVYQEALWMVKKEREEKR